MLGFMASCVLETSSEPSRQPLRAGDKTRSLKDGRVAVIDDPSINAANAGGGEFYVTTGLLQKANDEHLRGVLAHEIAHDDLGHVARA
jgi:predicted Zn-dependent protease